MKAFESAKVDEFEINSWKHVGIIYIKIVGYPSLKNGWIVEENYKTQKTCYS